MGSRKSDGEILRGVFQTIKWQWNFKYDRKERKGNQIGYNAMFDKWKDAAIKPSDYDKFGEKTAIRNTLRYLMLKQRICRWEQLVVNFLKEFLENMNIRRALDVPDPDPEDLNHLSAYPSPTPKELADRGELTNRKWFICWERHWTIQTNQRRNINYLIHPRLKI